MTRIITAANMTRVMATAPQPHPRERMIESAIALFRERGIEGTSFSDVLERSAARLALPLVPRRKGGAGRGGHPLRGRDDRRRPRRRARGEGPGRRDPRLR